MRVGWLMVLVVGCGREPVTAQPGDDTDDPALPDSPDLPADDTDAVGPVAPDPLSAEEIGAIQAAVEAWAAWSQALGVGPAWSAADRVEQLQRDACPYTYQTEWGARVWEDICTTVGGAEFFGFAVREVDGAMSSDAPDRALAALQAEAPALAPEEALPPRTAAVGVRLLAGFAVTSAQGDVVAVDGDFADVTLRTDAGGASVRLRALGGPVMDDLGGDWVAAGLKPELTITDVLDGRETLRVRTVDGAIGNLPGALTTVDAAHVTWRAEALGGCAAEPTGTVAVRRADGGWWELAFDAAACDGCAPVLERGVEVGQVCPSFAALAAPSRAEQVVP